MNELSLEDRVWLNVLDMSSEQEDIEMPSSDLTFELVEA